MNRSIIIVGTGIFGVTTALELRRRGWTVTLLDAGPVPRPTAASTDISKVVRMDYGADELYTALGEAALAGWDLWNHQWGEALYHQDGFLLLRRDAMQPGGFEHDSLALLRRRGQAVEALGMDDIKRRFPAWAAEKYPAGYLNPRAGWAESGKVVARLAEEARRTGIRLLEEQSFAQLLEKGSRITGIVTSSGDELTADLVLVAAGAWTPMLLPHLSEVMWPVGQPVLCFKAPNLTDYTAPRFPVWAADISRTGWYGFPALPDGTLKMANHGPGRRMHPDEPRTVLPGEEARFREFLRDTFPGLADAPLIGSRVCLYCDTADGNFWIDHDPDRPGLVVASGDNGHAFKFAPVLGGVIADVVEHRPNPFATRFARRTPGTGATEGARASQ
jgi:glycine/D-amino acid oxidase-like deaminating enzyme